MQYMFTNEEQMKDANMNGYMGRPRMSPEQKRLSTIMNYAEVVYPIESRDYEISRATLVEAMDEKNRADRYRAKKWAILP